ncbi:TetR/AcrR family transcriptional regulator [Spongiactinospora sp. 9N601]|uniref:TetR/AcrR family transcriptional regulator n=1 Tax=Spongiactinospora sp. 9N601 TaxID=3375149 RepID=UPI0037B5B266
MAVSRDQILTKATEHLNHSPAASMAEIAQSVGISRATLHRHFATREALMVALGWRALDAWQGIHERIGLGEPPAGERLGETLHALVLAQIEAAENYGFAVTEQAMETDRALVTRAEELEAKEIELISACQRAGILRADFPPIWVSNTLYGLLLAVRESLRQGDVARRDIPRLVLETFLRGTTS